MAENPRYERRYELRIVVPGLARAVVIRDPLNIAFSADKSVKPKLNRLQCRVFNLQPELRALLVKDQGTAEPDIAVELKVGYEGLLGTIFSGRVEECTSDREGADWSTEIIALDGGKAWQRGFVSATVSTKEQAIQAAVASWEGPRVGKVGAFRNTLTRSKVIMGWGSDVLDDITETGQSYFIDDGKLYLLREDEVVSKYIPVVKAETGLLRPPQGQKGKCTFESLLNPQLRAGGLCQLQSKTQPHLSGIYKIDTISYSGEYEGSEWYQSVDAVRIEEYSVPANTVPNVEELFGDG